jgi:aldose 1-epimerase
VQINENDGAVLERCESHGNARTGIKITDKSNPTLRHCRLHGGPNGFYNVLWKAKQITNGIELTYFSKDGEEGFPGNLTATVRYTLEKGALRVEYSATTDKPTVVNMTQHSYFNLAGQSNGDILGHQLTLHASKFTPVDAGLIPTGEIKSVASTPFDFLKSAGIGDRIEASDEQIKLGGGYDHNWVLDSSGGKLAEAAELYEPASGRVMKVSDGTGHPVLQRKFSGADQRGRVGSRIPSARRCVWKRSTIRIHRTILRSHPQSSSRARNTTA